MNARTYTPRSIITGYLSVYTLFTLASSLIWAINTVFLIREGGLTIFQVMVVNAVFTVGQVVFEVPTGVVADTIGRRASLLICMVILAISTLLYVLTPVWGWGIWGFIGASALLGLGFTFETGALDAWLVDALDATGSVRPKERVFSWGQMASGSGMLVGSLLGGVLGQIGLSVPYVVRTVLLVLAALTTALLIRDAGFTPRPFKLSTFGDETRRILQAGVTFGLRSRVVRPLLWSSLAGGVFFIYGFYSWQPYVLDLLGRDYVWLLGVVTAAFSLTGIAGNTLVKRIMREGELRREPARVLEFAAWATAALTFAIAAVGLTIHEPGILPAGIAIGLWLMFGLVFGIATPVRMSYINAHIPSAQRATVLSLDAFFADAGGSGGQPALGWISQRMSIPIGWLIGGTFLATLPLFYRASGKAARETGGDQPKD
jgi:Major Facilitator Superfamily.